MSLRDSKIRLATCFALVASLVASAGASAQRHHKREAREEIVSLEGDWRQAQLSDDVSAMDRLLSEDFLGITSFGQLVTKAQQLDRMRSRALVLNKLDITDVKIKMVGQIAIVTSLAAIEGSAEGKELSGSYRYTHVFQKLQDGAWKLTHFEATRIRGSGRHAHAAENAEANPPAH